MQLNDFIEGLSILQTYYINPNGYHISAEHDEFYAHATDYPLSAVDVERMVALGWRQPEAEYDGKFTSHNYDIEESWQAFV
jgi:hypothetical protein